MRNPLFNLFILFAFLISACKQSNDKSSDEMNTNEKFNSYKESFVEELWMLYPEWSSGVGYIKNDSVLKVPDENYRAEQLQFANNHLEKLKSFNTESLDNGNKTDKVMMQNFLQRINFEINELKSHEWNPSNYNVAGAIADVLNDKKRDAQQKLRMIYVRLKSVPDYYTAAQKNIKNPTLEHTELAIQQNRGALAYLQGAVLDSINKAQFKAHEEQSMTAAVDLAANAIKDYIHFLENKVKPMLQQGNARDFRIGENLYNKKFQYDIESGYSAKEIYEKALKRKDELHMEMARIAEELWPKYMANTRPPRDDKQKIKLLIERISTNHVHRDSFLIAVETQIKELIDFVNNKQLIYLDPSKPLVVRKTPEYMDGVAGASISSPGPYDKDGNTYYNVTPLTAYTDSEAESYLREYNHYILQILNIHEAIPGHYTQLVYANQSPSIIKSILGNGAMIEGWAVYLERMMLEEGYNNSPEMWLMYYKWHLRVVCNTILDYSVHVLNMDEATAMELLMNEAFQEEAEAKGKWKRVTLTSVQLCSYFTGYTEIYDLREEIKKKQGDKFNLKQFHETFLSFGSAPVREIKKLMED
ncbi:MAG: DUF885 domain-containing protein [Bacteroidia bacterium]